MQKIRKSFRSTAKSHKKFTLIELVVIVTIIAVTGTLLSALDSNTHAQAKQITCLDHLKKIGDTTQRYFDRYDERLVAYDTVVWKGKGQWGYRLIDSGLITDIKTKWKQYVCPQSDYTNVPKKNLDYCFTNWGYGINSGWIVENGVLYNDRDTISPYLEGYKSSKQSGAIVRNHAEQPGNVILFADTAVGSNPEKGYYLIDLRNKGRGFRDAHKVNRCNAVFLDGHAIAADKTKIAASGFPLSSDATLGTIKKIKNLYWYTSGGKFR